jgi:hypothetical protein
LARQDTGFRAFALSYIEATADTRDLKAVVSNARNHCSAESTTLCDAIAENAVQALKEAE